MLNKAVNLCRNEWASAKNEVPEPVRFYFKLRQDFFEEDGFVFLNNKTVVHSCLRNEMSNKIHERHFKNEKE